MKSTTTLNQLREGNLGVLYPQIRSFFSIGPTLLVINVLILGAFSLFNQGSNLDPGLVHLPSRTPSPTVLSTRSTRQRLGATKTPFSQSPLNFTLKVSPTIIPIPTGTIPPTEALPTTKNINGITGHPQSMPLSCESRSAVDWAAYFGKSINEYTFFNGLPVHSNPDKGFVGNVYGSWGQIPPYPYGVHAKPVAHRLREYGLNAKAVRGMTYKELKAEIASGQPVIVWVVGHVNRGTPVPYTAPGGANTVVAKFEHTVIVIGYNENKVTILDGARVYSTYKGEFMKSWNVLENQAVIWLD